MSAEAPQDQAKDKEFVKQFSKDLEAAVHTVAEKYPGMIQDIGLVINWTPENHKKPYPKLMIETMRNTESENFDPIRQALELSELLNMGGLHILRQTLFITLQEISQMRQQAQPGNGPKIVIPGQG